MEVAVTCRAFLASLSAASFPPNSHMEWDPYESNVHLSRPKLPGELKALLFLNKVLRLAIDNNYNSTTYFVELVCI